MTLAAIDAIPREQLRGQSALVRIDAADDASLRDSLATLNYLSESGARVVIATHCGLPSRSIESIRTQLTELLGRRVTRLNDWKGEAGQRVIAHLGEGEMLIISDLSFEPGEPVGDNKLATELAGLCDIYCNDAFALSHQIRASTVGVAKRTKLAVAGLAFEREVNMLGLALDHPRRPLLAILGGELSKEKLLLAEDIARRSESTFVGGGLCIPLLAARGVVPGSFAVGDEIVKIAERMLTEARDDKRDLTTPVDFTVVDKVTFERLSRGERFVFGPPTKNVREDEIQPDHVFCDVGESTRWSLGDRLGPARTIFWHGALGMIEFEPFGEGTRFLAAELANRVWPSIHTTVICGSSLVRSLRQMGIQTAHVRHLTSAGHATLHYFAGRSLPAVDILNSAGKSAQRPLRILIPLDGSDADANAVNVTAQMATREVEILLLHVLSGPDEEHYPDLIAALSEAEKFERRNESERIFARANSILASHGLISADQMTTQGDPAEMILRRAGKLEAGLIVLSAGVAKETNGIRRVAEQARCEVLVTPSSVAARAARTPYA